MLLQVFVFVFWNVKIPLLIGLDKEPEILWSKTQSMHDYI